jgi:hypothetical protein
MTTTPSGADQRFTDTTAYGNGPQLGDRRDRERGDHPPHRDHRRSGHPVQRDGRAPGDGGPEQLSQPAAKIFYVAFTADLPDPTERPVTFFYNGGPGSSSVYVMPSTRMPVRCASSSSVT